MVGQDGRGLMSSLGLPPPALLRRCHGDAFAQEPTSLRAGSDIALAINSRFAGHTVIALMHGATLQRIALVLRRVIVDRASFGLGQGGTGFPAASGNALVGLATVAHGHVMSVARLRLG